jgi:hypothetical protein
MTPLELVVSKLQAAGCDPSETGINAYESRCPVHRGKRKNLSVGVGAGGKVLLHCHHVDQNGQVGCLPFDITRALGLGLADLAPGSCNGSTTRPKTAGKPKRSWKSPDDVLRAVAAKILHQPTTLTTWTYQNADTTPSMVVGRIDDASGYKTYRPVHVLADGTWAIGDPPGLLPLYGLPWIEQANMVFVVEGEKCADAILGLDWVATTSAHGAQSPKKTDWSPLAGKDVVLIPDNDADGEGYATSVLRLLKRLDPRPRVKLVRLPGLADGEDVADWIPGVVGNRVGDEAQRAVCSELERLILAAPKIDLDTIADAPSQAAGPVVGSLGAEAPIAIPEWPKPPEDVAFQGLAGEVVKLIEPTSEADPVGVLLQLLIGFGNAIGSGLCVVADGHAHHANEFVVTVGETSRSRKGTAWRRAQPYLAHVDSNWADKRVTHGLSSGEGLIHEIRDQTLGIDKKTSGTVVTDPGVDDKRVMVVESEFGTVLRVLAREGNTLSDVLRLAWDGDDLRTMTKHSPARATKPHVSMAGHITQQELAKYLDHVEVFNGLGNRIAWACVRRSKSLPFPGSVDGKSMLDVGTRLAAAADLARGVGVMAWTSAGKTLWESEYGRLTEDRPGLWGAITSRAEAHVLRLSTIFASLDRSREIADTHVLAALAVWGYCDRSAAFLFGGSLGDRDADWILDALRAKPAGMTRTDISVEVFSRNRTADVITRALGLLLKYKLARCEPAGNGQNERWFAVIS